MASSNGNGINELLNAVSNAMENALPNEYICECVWLADVGGGGWLVKRLTHVEAQTACQQAMVCGWAKACIYRKCRLH